MNHSNKNAHSYPKLIDTNSTMAFNFMSVAILKKLSDWPNTNHSFEMDDTRKPHMNQPNKNAHTNILNT